MPCFFYKSECFRYVLCAQFEIEKLGAPRKKSEYNGPDGIVQCLNVKIFYHAYHRLGQYHCARLRQCRVRIAAYKSLFPIHLLKHPPGLRVRL